MSSAIFAAADACAQALLFVAKATLFVKCHLDKGAGTSKTLTVGMMWLLERWRTHWLAGVSWDQEEAL